VVERAAWTEERLDDLSAGTREGFARVDRDIRDLRAEMHQGFSDLRAEMHSGFAEMRGAIQRQNLALVVGLISLIATILARGA
jgi:hypothetical protein